MENFHEHSHTLKQYKCNTNTLKQELVFHYIIPKNLSRNYHYIMQCQFLLKGVGIASNCDYGIQNSMLQKPENNSYFL